MEIGLDILIIALMLGLMVMIFWLGREMDKWLKTHEQVLQSLQSLTEKTEKLTRKIKNSG